MSGRAGLVLFVLLLLLGSLAGGIGVPGPSPALRAQLYPSPFVDKHLFLHPDENNTLFDRIDLMNTSGIRPAALPGDYDGDDIIGVTLWNGASWPLNLFGFYANPSGSPAFARDLYVWNATAVLYLFAQFLGTYQINVSLYRIGLTVELLGYVNTSVSLPSMETRRVTVALPTINAVVPAGETLLLAVTRWDAQAGVIVFGFDASSWDSRLVVRTNTYIHIDAPTGVFVGGSPRVTLSDVEPPTVIVNVSDPFGAAHIERASIEVFDPGSVRIASSGNLTLPNATDSSAVPAWKRFEFVLPALAAPGIYTVRINATDIDRLLPNSLRVPMNWNTSYAFTFEVYLTLDHFVVNAPGQVEAGALFTMDLEARSRADYAVSNWTGVVVLSAVPLVAEPPGTLGIAQATVVANGTLTLASQSYTKAHPIQLEVRNGSAAGLSAPIQVRPAAPSSIIIAQPSPYVTTAGVTVVFQAEARDPYGNLNDSWTATWNGSGSGAAVSSAGMLTPTVAGTGSVTVRASGVSGVEATITIIVLPAPVASVTLTPTGPVVNLVAGTNQTFVATGRDAYGNINLTWQANWALDDPTLGLLDPINYTATLTPTKVGSTTLRVTNGAIGASVGLSIAPGPLARIQLNPSNPQLLDPGDNLTITATAYDAYGNEIPVWTPAWQVNGSIGQIFGTTSVVLFIAQEGTLQGSIIVSANGVEAELLIVTTGAVAAPQPPWGLIGGIAAAAAAAAGGAIFWLRRRPQTIIDEVFLMTPTGLLLKHFTRRLKPDQDDSILAGMLTAVQDFVKDSFRESGGEVDEIKFKDFRIMIARAPHVLMAAVVSGERTDLLQGKLNRVTRAVEAQYGATLAEWSGDLSELTGVDKIVSELFTK